MDYTSPELKIDWPVLLKSMRVVRDGKGEQVNYTSTGTGFFVQALENLNVLKKDSSDLSPPLPSTKKQKTSNSSNDTNTSNQKNDEAFEAYKIKRDVDFSASREICEDFSTFKLTLGHSDESSRTEKIWLISNVHVFEGIIKDGGDFFIYLRPEGAEQFHVFPLKISISDIVSPHNDEGEIDVGALALTYTGHVGICGNQRNPLMFSKESNNSHLTDSKLSNMKNSGYSSQLIDPVVEDVKVRELLFCSGFPLLYGQNGKLEPYTWDVREPCCLSGTVVCKYPSLNQFRVSMLTMWGMSGSLVFRVNGDVSNRLEPMGIFAEMRMGMNNGVKFDSSIRVVFNWSVLEGILNKGEGYRIVVVKLKG